MHHDDEWIPVSPDNCDLIVGPFYHGTKANLSVGDLLTAGFRSNYDNSVVMNHIYFTVFPKGAGLAAEMAKGNGRPRVYVVMPTGIFEDDPNVTNKKFREKGVRFIFLEHGPQSWLLRLKLIDLDSRVAAALQRETCS